MDNQNKTKAQLISELEETRQCLSAVQQPEPKHKQDAALLESEYRYRALFEESPIPLWEEDFSLVKKKIDQLKQRGIKDFRKFFDENPGKVTEYVGMVKVLELNKAVLELHEAKLKTDLLEDLNTVFTKEAFRIFKEELIAMSEGRCKCEFETVGKTLKGEEKYIQLNWVVVAGYEDTMEKVYVSTLDITKRKLAEKALKESENKYRTLFEQTADAILIIEGDKFVDCNLATVKLLGYTNKKELLETHPSQLSPEVQPDGRGSFEKANEMIAIAFDRGSHRFEWIHKKKNNKIFPVEVLLTSIPYEDSNFLHVVWRDISERKYAEEEKEKLEKQLQRDQKLKTIGTLAGGIAHDFNNILTPILGYTDMAIEELIENDPIRQNLNRVMEGANRAKDLVEQILLFSKQIERDRIPLSLHLIVKEALQLLRSSIPTTIEIVQKIDPYCDKVLADATQLHQVIVNLCTNAWQSMEEKGGTLTIELKQVEVDEAKAKIHPNLKEAKYICLSIKDTGYGMHKAILDRIFEPFFTTKPVDKGTGLGLSVVHGIIQNHEGDILVESEPSCGTTFHVYLPVIQIQTEKRTDKSQKILKGREAILVVDDDIAVGKMIKQMLEKFGYFIDLCTTSSDALDVFKKQPDKYDLVISDLTMPNLTGIDLSRRLQEERPDIPIIIMTGYRNQLVEVDKKSCGIKKVIEKPVIMNDLASAIREVLDD